MVDGSQLHGGIEQCRRSPHELQGIKCPSSHLKKRNGYAFFSIWLIGRFADGNCRGGSTDGIFAWFIPEARVLIVMNEQVALQSA